MQNCEDVVRMGGCAQGGADYCCACSESPNGIEIKKIFFYLQMFFSCQLLQQCPPKDRRFEQNSQTLASVLWGGDF